MTRKLIPIVAAATALLALSACETAPQDSETITWNTPRQGEMQPAQQAATPTEPECREFQTTVTIGGRPEKAYGRACRQPDGTWKQVGNLDTTPETAAAPTLQSYPYGWYGYEYPYGPRYGPGYSVGIGAGTGGGFIGYGVGF